MIFSVNVYPAGNYMFKVNCEHISHLVLFLLLTSNMSLLVGVSFQSQTNEYCECRKYILQRLKISVINLGVGPFKYVDFYHEVIDAGLMD